MGWGRLPRRDVAVLACAAGALVAIASLSAPALAAEPASCAAQEAALTRDASELPKVELANPGDQQNTCITLEVNVDFAAKLAAHAARCPQSALAAKAPDWAAKAQRDRAAFTKRKCKPTL